MNGVSNIDIHRAFEESAIVGLAEMFDNLPEEVLPQTFDEFLKAVAIIDRKGELLVKPAILHTEFHLAGATEEALQPNASLDESSNVIQLPLRKQACDRAAKLIAIEHNAA